MGRVGSDAPKTVAYSSLSDGNQAAVDIHSFTENGLVGYRTSSAVVLPCQLEAGSEFTDGVAVVTLKGKSGLLRWVENGQMPKVVPVDSRPSYSSKAEVECKLRVDHVPVNLQKMNVEVCEAQGRSLVAQPQDNNVFSFKVQPSGKAGKEEREFCINVVDAGLILSSENITYTLVKKALVSVALSVGNTNANGQAPVIASITNRNSEPVTITVTLRGSEQAFKETSQEITIPGGGSRSISSYFTVLQKLSGQWVEVTTSEGVSERKTGLTLYAYAPNTPPSPAQSLSIAIQVSNIEADATGKCHVTAVISNHGSSVVNTTVTMRGSDAFVGKSEHVTIPAGGKKAVSSYFQIKGAKVNQWVEVSTSNGDKSRKNVPQLTIK